MKNKKELNISVRNLVEYVYKSGSIDSSFSIMQDAIDGIREHQRIQAMRKKELLLVDGVYEKEKSFKVTFDMEDYKVTIKGRADGVGYETGRIYVEEIKTTKKNLDTIEPLEVHFAQGIIYAYFITLEHNEEINQVEVMLTYSNINTNNTRSFTNVYDKKNLKIFFDFTIDKYLTWIKKIHQWQEKRDKSIGELSFPFDSYRKGQREGAVAVYRSLQRSKNLFVSAPTGIGKTILTLFPSIKSLSHGLSDKIFYLTAKSLNKNTALDSVLLMQGDGLNIKATVLTAKEKICPIEKMQCNPETCIYASNHYDRVNIAVDDIFEKEMIFDKENILRYSEIHTVCPYEFSLDTALYSDIIICDYNYVFDPRTYLRRFFEDTNNEEYLFLIDEAHNLVDRSRDMFSASLSVSEIRKVNSEIKSSKNGIKSHIKSLRSYIENKADILTENDFGALIDIAPDFIINIKELILKLEVWLPENKGNEHFEEFLGFYFKLINFENTLEIRDNCFETFIKREDRDIIISVFCLDPSPLLAKALKKARASVFFSATLYPLQYYRNILGGKDTDYMLSIESPFQLINFKTIVAGYVSTKFKHRDKSYTLIAEYIYNATKIKKGNYMIFFPSYAYMNRVFEEFTMHYKVNAVAQKSEMSDWEREAFLEMFDSSNQETLLGFCVLGGLFSEGIDLKGDRLIGAVIVGVGLPQIGFERNLIRDYYDKKSGSGFEYAYMFHGMNKILQAGGRVIRSSEDRGFVLLIDTRFLEKKYMNILPGHWRNMQVIRKPSEIQPHLEEFWDY